MASGMSFISNRWVFTGPQSYTVEPAVDESGDYVVWSVNAAGRTAVSRGPEGQQREMAAILNDRH
jgi:hypothetical protein